MNDESAWYQETKRKIDEKNRSNILRWFYRILSILIIYCVISYANIPLLRDISPDIRFLIFFFGLWIIYSRFWKPKLMREVTLSAREIFCFNIYEMGIHLSSLEESKLREAIEKDLFELTEEIGKYEIELDNSILNYDEYELVRKLKILLYKVNYLMKNKAKIPAEIPRLFKELSDRIYNYSKTGDIFPIKNKIEEINRAFPMKTKEDQEIGTPILQTIKESPLAQTIAVLSVLALIALVLAYYPISALLERKLELGETLMIITIFVAFGAAYLSQRKKH